MTDDNECPICYNAMDTSYTNPCCKNKFHVDCLSVWYKRSQSCPCCRSKDIRNGPFTALIPMIYRVPDRIVRGTNYDELMAAISLAMARREAARQEARQAVRDIRRQAAIDTAKEAKIAKIQEKTRLAVEKAAKKEAKEAAKLAKKEAAKAAKAAKKKVIAVAVVADHPITLAGQAALRRAAIV